MRVTHGSRAQSSRILQVEWFIVHSYWAPQSSWRFLFLPSGSCLQKTIWLPTQLWKLPYLGTTQRQCCPTGTELGLQERHLGKKSVSSFIWGRRVVSCQGDRMPHRRFHLLSSIWNENLLQGNHYDKIVLSYEISYKVDCYFIIL